MILPGDPSKKAKIAERTLVSTGDPVGPPPVPYVAQIDATPTSGDEQFGVDVTRWQSVKVFHFSDENDANFEGSRVTIKPWYWYAPTSFYLPQAWIGATTPAHGVWISGKDTTLALDGTYDARAQYATYSTNNADRMFFQIKEYHNGTGGEAVVWYKQAVFGLVPRPSDGAAVLAAVVDTNDAGDADVGGGDTGGGVGTGDVVVYNATGAAAINLTTAEIVPFELIDVTVHFNVAPTTSQNLLVTLNAADGAAYDTVMLLVNPATYLGGVTDIVWKPESRFFFEVGDQVVVTYTNTDLRTYGVRIVVAR
jgi:hypothetical protein